MIFEKTLTETLLLKNPKNPEIDPKTWYVNEKFSVIVEWDISLER